MVSVRLSKSQFVFVAVPASFSCTGGRRDIKLDSDQSGSLASFNYPLPYEGKVECTWVIQAESGYQVEISFDFFSLSEPRYGTCLEDYVKIESPYDYEVFCGTEKPEPVTSYKSQLTVVFKSSGKKKYPGFKATYQRKSKFMRFDAKGNN